MSKRMPQDPKVVFVDLDQKKYEAEQPGQRLKR